MKMLLLRPYYGVSVHGDMHGDLGIADFLPHVFPDLSMVNAGAIANSYSSVDLCVIDANAEQRYPKSILESIRNEKFDVIVVKATAPTIKYDICFSKFLKRYYPFCRVVIVGHVVKMLRKWIQDEAPEIDAAGIGMEDCVFGIITGENRHLPIEEYPSPDYTLFPCNAYIDNSNFQRATLYTAHGCKLSCNYCPYRSYFKYNYEERSLEKVLDDIEKVLSLGFSRITFRDQFFTVDKKRTIALCNSIVRRNLKFRWTCETRIESLNRALIDAMREAGLEFVGFGIESASVKNLEQSNRKGAKKSRVRNIIGYLNDNEIHTLAFFMIGFPDDTWESVMDTYKLSIELKSQWSKFSIYSLYPNATIWKEYGTPSDITPDLFTPFENTTEIDVSSHLSKEDLRFSLDEITLMHHAMNQGLAYARMISAKQIEHRNHVRFLIQKLDNVPTETFEGFI